jgi:hypothetical protein
MAVLGARHSGAASHLPHRMSGKLKSLFPPAMALPPPEGPVFFMSHEVWQ